MHPIRSAFLALPLLFAGTLAEAAPQILGIVASNGLPTPLHCAKGFCSAYLASFCLQEARYAPNSGSEYSLAPGGRLTLVAKLQDGRMVRLPGETLLAIRTRSGFSTLSVSVPESTLARIGAHEAVIEVGPGTTVVPKAYAGDPHPQSADEIATATGPMRDLASGTFDRPGEEADAARLVELVINRAAAQSDAAPALANLWGDVVVQASRSGISKAGVEAAGGIVAECASWTAGAGGFTGRVCLEMRQAELMSNLNRRFWDQAAGGS